MSLAEKIDIANISDVGRRRPHNEDSTLSNLDEGVAVLADGMGGYKAGEVASAIAVMTTYNNIKAGIQRINTGQIQASTGLTGVSDILKKAVVQANANIYNTAESDAECQGMGTTIVACLFHDNMITVAYVGDSRLYRKRGGTLSQVTKDHSLIQELIDKGVYTPEEAIANTPKNLVTRALGIEETVEVDVLEEAVQVGDIYLLCSDGLNDMVDDEEIHLTLSKYSANLLQVARELVRKANEKGGKDNISVILIRVQETFSSSGEG